MITEAMLRSAATKSCEIYTAQLQSGYDADKQHIFSLDFETKIRKLKRKADHLFFYRFTVRVASIFLALFISISAWLAVDIEARAAVIGWIKEVYESFFVYRYEDDSNTEVTSTDFRPSWLPDGYSEFAVNDTADTIMVIYANDAGEMLKFSYAHNSDKTDWFIDATDTVRTSIAISVHQADLLTSTNPAVASAILWTTPDNTAFYISGFLSESALIRVAENIQEIEK